MSRVFEALVATAVGLLVAIPAVVTYKYFQGKARTALAQEDSQAHLLLQSQPAPREFGGHRDVLQRAPDD